MTIKNLMLEYPHRCMHDQFCIKFPNHHCCMCIMEIMWDVPFIPEPLAKPWHILWPAVLQALSQIPTYHKPWPRVRMSILALGGKQKKEERKKIPNQRRGEKKKERKFSIKDRKKTEETCKKVFRPDNIWTIQNCHQINKKKGERKPQPKVVLSLWLPTKCFLQMVV